MTVGSIVFGPRPVSTNGDLGYALRHASTIALTNARACNCVGPQSGQTKCPCALSGEMARAQQMLADGVIIDGKRYRLVPEGDGI